MDMKAALIRSQAGMRLIAQLHIYNSGDFDRLRTFIADSYTEALLEDQSVDERLAYFQQLRETHGKLRIFRIVGHDEHRVIVLLAGQKDATYCGLDISVQDDHPHQITEFLEIPTE
jgi:hypothetical protein